MKTSRAARAFHLRIPVDLQTEIDTRCQQSGASRSAVVTAALRRALDTPEPDLLAKKKEGVKK